MKFNNSEVRVNPFFGECHFNRGACQSKLGPGAKDYGVCKSNRGPCQRRSRRVRVEPWRVRASPRCVSIEPWRVRDDLWRVSIVPWVRARRALERVNPALGRVKTRLFPAISAKSNDLPPSGFPLPSRGEGLRVRGDRSDSQDSRNKLMCNQRMRIIFYT